MSIKAADVSNCESQNIVNGKMIETFTSRERGVRNSTSHSAYSRNLLGMCFP